MNKTTWVESVSWTEKQDVMKAKSKLKNIKIYVGNDLAMEERRNI